MDEITPIPAADRQGMKWQLSLLIIFIGPIMAMLDSSIVNVAIATMMNDFQTTTSHIQWVVTIYMLALGVIVPTSGWLGDYLGYKRLYLYSLFSFTLGSALCSIALSENFLIAARVIQAIGGGMIMPTTMSMLYKIVPREKIGSAMGMFGISMMVAPALGPTLGGYLVEYVNWRWIFTINVPIGIIGILLAASLIPEFPQNHAGSFDILGCLTSSSALFCLLLALSQGQDWGWTSISIVLLIYSSIALFILFVFHELTTPNPLLDLRVFKNPSFAMGNLIMVIVTIGMYAGLFYVPLFLQSIRGLGALKVGLLMLPPALVSGIFLPISGKLYDRFGPIPPVSIGILLISFSTYLFTNLNLNTPLSTIIGWNCIRSIGMGLTMMPVQTAIMNALPADKIGRGSAITNIISRVAGAFGLAFLTILLNDNNTYFTAYLNWTINDDNLKSLIVSGVADRTTVMTLLQINIAKLAFVKAIDNLFFLTALITLPAFFLTFFLPRKKELKSPSKEIPSAGSTSETDHSIIME
ncbi:drug resistance transporter, EmrB/QacA subfamily [Syntrophobotulus glycolicus DSM 8271]|uniref:Drug resistance transporter, EmrB/QacA subfamily n=1 Tax=Syntrophobotulus glycolicus (strain DSM 8271 / FlGlyR) TaxID=645991 RepID=F0SWB9_SYNGF|nr:DHA2 family efflux MFS transporter permease subunit [Syntrophobotulus glycolicus]ADY54605.1 drug resistance transporter, EmrB/QacA subfamily [Syntrophobotulus glycolicus DSM 8271]